MQITITPFHQYSTCSKSWFAWLLTIYLNFVTPPPPPTLFSGQQDGFRSHHSCVSYLLEYLNAWTQGVCNPGTGTDTIYIDGRNAFDSMSPIRHLVTRQKCLALLEVCFDGSVIMIYGWLTVMLYLETQDVTGHMLSQASLKYHTWAYFVFTQCERCTQSGPMPVKAVCQ